MPNELSNNYFFIRKGLTFSAEDCEFLWEVLNDVYLLSGSVGEYADNADEHAAFVKRLVALRDRFAGERRPNANK